MTGRVFGVSVSLLLAAILVYASRYWPLSLWGREGLFGLDWLPPQGALIRNWTGGTLLSPFDIVLWGIAAFLLLTLVQTIRDKLK
ncbi:MAG: hypothetical protein KTR19_00470 [Hyphomicrobiales bacterium]|nr:hypothetical protein [Hyphomicrobiales bacterium]